jgi:hypothetical protein
MQDVGDARKSSGAKAVAAGIGATLRMGEHFVSFGQHELFGNAFCLF